MLIISIRDSENSRWNRNVNKTATNKDRKEQGGQAIVKGWELNDFVVH